MKAKQNTGGLDIFRLAAAFLVVAIHTSPLSSFSAEGDFFLTRVLARTAVPFFFMVTGQFVLSDSLFSGREGDGALFRPGEKAGAAVWSLHSPLFTGRDICRSLPGSYPVLCPTDAVN